MEVTADASSSYRWRTTTWDDPGGFSCRRALPWHFHMLQDLLTQNLDTADQGTASSNGCSSATAVPKTNGQWQSVADSEVGNTGM